MTTKLVNVPVCGLCDLDTELSVYWIDVGGQSMRLCSNCEATVMERARVRANTASRLAGGSAQPRLSGF